MRLANIGRFITQDPIGLMGGMNLYRFANNTQAWVDPLGTDARTSCSYKIGQQELSCTRTESEKFLGIFTKSSKSQTITINSADGVFSGGITLVLQENVQIILQENA